MRTMFAFAAAGLALIAAQPAFAQEDDEDTKVALTPVEQFSGLHVEGTIGYDHLSTTSYRTIGTVLTTTQGSGNGLRFGGAIGYDFPVTDHLTVGGELGVYGSAAKWNNTANLTAGSFDTQVVKPKTDVFAGIKVGYVLNPRTQVFAKAGYTTTKYSVYATDGSEALHEGVSGSGYRAGIGIERELTKTIYVKLEYAYSHYGSGSFNYSDMTPNASTYVLRSTRQLGQASVGFRF